MWKNTIYFVLLACSLCWSDTSFGQFIFNPTDTVWYNNDGQPYPWTLRPRTGVPDSSGNTFPDKRTKYYISDGLPGYLEFLPQGYDAPQNQSKLYPLILFLPGCGEIHHGQFYLHPPIPGVRGAIPNTSLGLGRLFSPFGSFAAIPTECRENGSYLSRVPQKTRGASYNYNFGPREGFIVMNLMFRGEPVLCSGVQPPTVEDIDRAIDVAKSLYRVDPQRIYLTGMSQGGVQPWDFSSSPTRNKLAAAIPVAGYGQSVDGPVRAQQIIDNQTHIFSICNLYDYNTNGTSKDVILDTETGVNNLLAQPGGSNYITVLHFLYSDPSQPTFSSTNQPPGLNEAQVLAAGYQNHDAWNRAYPGRFGDDLRKEPVYVDPVSGETYTLYEWMLLYRNQLIVLPVNVATFTANRNDAGVELEWVTVTEINSEEFIIERSEDGNNYKKLSSLPAAGNSTKERRYSYQDRDVPNTNYIYYRLMQRDRDGKLQVIGVKKVFIGVKGFHAKVYPTIATTTLSVEIQSVVNDRLTLRIVDVSGKLLKEQTLAPRQIRTSIDVSGLSKGVYFMQAFSNDHRMTVKFVKD